MNRLLLLLLLLPLAACEVEVPDDDDVIEPITPDEVPESDYTRTGQLFCGAGGWATDIADMPVGSYESFNCVGPVAAGAHQATDGTFTAQTNPMLGLATTPTVTR